MNNYNGRLISIEGIDGTGKGTVIGELKNNYFPDFEYTAEPSNGKYGRKVREELQTDSDPTASDFFLFCADRFDHIHSLIGPKLDKDQTVITDRYNLSTYAYQSRVIDEDMDVVSPYEYIDRVLGQFVIEPDLTILIDAPVAEIFGRLDNEKEKYEKIDRLKEARRNYLYFAEKFDYVEIVDGTQDPESVLNNCVELIDSL